LQKAKVAQLERDHVALIRLLGFTSLGPLMRAFNEFVTTEEKMQENRRQFEALSDSTTAALIAQKKSEEHVVQAQQQELQESMAELSQKAANLEADLSEVRFNAAKNATDLNKPPAQKTGLMKKSLTLRLSLPVQSSAFPMRSGPEKTLNFSWHKPGGISQLIPK
jgi:t-SNARE complex subunit (syntaxin)